MREMSKPRIMSISIRAPLAGSDCAPSSRRWTSRYFNPRSPCGERQDLLPCGSYKLVISIRAPLAGSDAFELDAFPFRFPVISIRAPLAGSDADKRSYWESDSLFQSALPLRGATGTIDDDKLVELVFQSALPLRGATRGRRVDDLAVAISIRAPLAGSDRYIL